MSLAELDPEFRSETTWHGIIIFLAHLFPRHNLSYQGFQEVSTMGAYASVGLGNFSRKRHILGLKQVFTNDQATNILPHH